MASLQEGMISQIRWNLQDKLIWTVALISKKGRQHKSRSQVKDSQVNLGESSSIRYTSRVRRIWQQQFRTKSGRSAAWLARYLGVVEVVGSNPAGPIDENPAFPNGFTGFFRFSVEWLSESKVSEFAPK